MSLREAGIPDDEQKLLPVPGTPVPVPRLKEKHLSFR